MANTNAYSKRGYLALKKESTAGTAIKPDTYIELLEENIKVSYNNQPIDSIAGVRSNRIRTVNDKITVEGSITVYADANTIGYFLECCFGDATTTTLTAATAFQHVFTPANALVTYTFDVKKAANDFVYRYAGVRINRMQFSQVDNKIQVTIDIVAQKAFTSARATSAPNSGTALSVDQTSCLTTSDSIIIKDKADHTTEISEHTVTTVTDELTLVVSTISSQIDLLDIITIKASTPTYDLGKNMTWIGGADYLIGSTDPYPVDNTAAVDVDDFSCEFTNDLDVRHSAVGVNHIDRYPTNILLKSFGATGSFTKFMESIGYLEDLRNSQKIGTRLRIEGDTIEANSVQAATVAFGTPGGADGVVTVTASTAGRAAEDYNIKQSVNDTDDLAAAFNPTGSKNIKLELASTTGSKNTATLVAAAINGLTGVGAAASGTGATEFTIAAADKINLGDTTEGRDASENESLQISFHQTKYDVFGQDVTADDIINEEINFIAEHGEEDADNEMCRIVLRNGVTSY